MTIKRILVPVDFSLTSLRALDYAIDLSKPFAAEIILLHVFEPFYYATPTGLYGPADKLAKVVDEQKRHGGEQLDRLAKTVSKRNVAALTILQSGTPYEVIVDTAKKMRADLIALGTHGRTGLAHMLIGSVTEKVVRSAGCPVLTVPTHKAAKRPRR